jgi:ABC-type hemin transport system ATPase subunit
VSHDLNLAASFSKRVLLLSESGGDGATIFAFGTPHEVLTGANIEKVYRTPVLVDCLPGSSAVRISLMPQHSRAGELRGNAS